MDNKLIYTKISGLSPRTFDEFKVNQRRNSQDVRNYIQFDEWEKFIDQKRSIAPPGFESVRQTSNDWLTLETNGAFYLSLAWTSLTLIFLVTLIYLFHTRNYTMTALMFFTLNIIISSIVSIAKFSQWGVSSAVVISIPIIIAITGYSFQFLASYYMHAPVEMNRNVKMQYAYQEMGVSVSIGLLVTSLSSIWLLFSKVMLFQKVGIILLCCGIYAYYGSMIFFGTICDICGPEEEMQTVPIYILDEYFNQLT
jgi:hypothetical protein